MTRYIAALTLILTLFFNAAMPASAQLRPMVYTEKTVNAPLGTVWADWTTAEGLESFFAPKAIIEAMPGGDYVIWFAPDAPEGQRGSDNGIVLGLQNEADGARMISFTWAMPPYMPEIRPHMTVVQLWLVPVTDGKTQLLLFHTGFGDTLEWEKGREYFSKTWPTVMTLYEEHIEGTKAP